MYSAGRNARLDEGESELFDNLSLVGVSGRFCGILTERQLTFQDFGGYGIRIKLSNISTLRNINIARLPVGFLTMGMIGTWVGLQVLVPPVGWAVAAASLTSAGMYLTMKTPVLSIETNSGDKYLVTGSQSELLRLCMMVDRVMHGTTIEDAKEGLKKLEEEMRSRQSVTEPKALLQAPDLITTPEMDLFDYTTTTQTVSTSPTPASVMAVSGSMGVSNTELPSGGIFASLEEHAPPAYSITPPVQSQQKIEPQDNRSAYERAWGRPEPPPWYQEKETQHSENRMDEVFSDAVGSFNIFEDGGIFDSEPNDTMDYATPPTTPTYSSPTEDIGLFSSDSFPQSSIATNRNPISNSRPPSSFELIRSAQQNHGLAEQRDEWNLPSPTESAVREECRPGLVRTAKARQAYLTESSTSSELSSTPVDSEKFEEEFPAISKLANSMGNGRIRGTQGKPKKQNWIESLLSPKPRRVEFQDSYSAEYGDNDGGKYDRNTRFRSSQLLRLRSDQDHQADLVSRVRNMNASPSTSSAKDKLDEIVSGSITDDGFEPPALRTESELRFNQLKRTGSKDKQLPGIRRLD